MADFARVTIDGVEYACSEGVAAVCGRSAEIVEENVVVRGSVSANEKVYVVEILAKEVFAKMLIRSVKLPNTVMSIPEKCFELCKNLSDVVFEEGSRVSVFGKCCFKGCAIVKIDIPDSVLSIEDKCFDGCTELCSVGICETSKLMKLGSYVFRGCQVDSLFLPDSVEISQSDGVFVGVQNVVAKNPWDFAIGSDCILSSKGTTLITCFTEESTFVVPDSVKKIKKGCFTNIPLKRVVFGKCSSIEELWYVFGDSSIEEIVFQGCISWLFRG